MRILNFFRRARPGLGVNKAFPVSEQNRLFNVLEDLQGEGCHIEKPLDGDGKGWKIVVDGLISDTAQDYYHDGLMPFDIVRLRDGWRVYLEGATVWLDNAIIPMQEGLEEDNFTATLFGAGEIFLYICRKQGDQFGLEWLVSTRRATGSFVFEIELGEAGGLLFQYFHGSVAVYSNFPSGCIAFDTDTGRYELRDIQNDAAMIRDLMHVPGIPPEQISLVYWQSETVKYIQLPGFLDSCTDSVEQEMEETLVTPGGWDMWEAALIAWLENHGYPWQPRAETMNCSSDDGAPVKNGDACLATLGGWRKVTENMVAGVGVATTGNVEGLLARLEVLGARAADIAEGLDDQANIDTMAELSTANDEARNAASDYSWRAEALVMNTDEVANTANYLESEASNLEAQMANFETRLDALEAAAAAKGK